MLARSFVTVRQGEDKHPPRAAHEMARQADVTRAYLIVFFCVTIAGCDGPNEPDPRGRYAYTVVTSEARTFRGSDAEFFSPAQYPETHLFQLYIGDSLYFSHFSAPDVDLPRAGTYQAGHGVMSDQVHRMAADVYNVLAWPVWVDEELSTITLDSVAADRIIGRFDLTLIHQSTFERVGKLTGHFDARRRVDCRLWCSTAAPPAIARSYQFR